MMNLTKDFRCKRIYISLCQLLKNEYDIDDLVQYEEYLDFIANTLSFYDSPAIRYKYIVNVSKVLSNSYKEVEVLINDLSH